jgi:uncharacterized protein YndB with AHSA1/START domain
MSKETEIEETILITRSPEAIWDYIGDARNDPNWCAKVVSVEQVSGDCPGPDARYRVIHRSARLKTPNELGVTVEEFDPPPRVRLREEDDDAVFDVTYELQSERGGTRLTQRDRIEWKIPRFQLRLARRMVTRDIEKQLAALKRVLEPV